MRPRDGLKRDCSSFQFTLRMLTIAMYALAVFLAICRRVIHPGDDAGQLTLTLGLALYLGGCVALWIVTPNPCRTRLAYLRS